MTEDIEHALSHVDATDREIWVRMGMAIFSELGPSGFDIWDQWSQTAGNYHINSAKHVWRGFNSGGGVNIASLFYVAQLNGWSRNARSDSTPSAPTRDTRAEDALRSKNREKAAGTARQWMARAIRGAHPYLARKGFEGLQALVYDGKLLVPMHDLDTGALCSIQSVDSDGNKRFLKGGRTSRTGFAMGVGPDIFLVEGYATGLSVLAAIELLHFHAQVVVCFSAQNMLKMHGDFVVADHDVSGTGQKYAERTGLPWWMPPVVGDANDYHQSAGLQALAKAVSSLEESARSPSHMNQLGKSG